VSTVACGRRRCGRGVVGAAALMAALLVWGRVSDGVREAPRTRKVNTTARVGGHG
jgi:hypothetical protein